MRRAIKSPNCCAIVWDKLSPQEWDSHFARVRRSTLLQSRAYGDAMAIVNHQRVRRGLITMAGKAAGLVQILEAGILGNAVHGVIIDRGPLWFEGFGSTADFAQFMERLRADFPKRIGRKVRIIPEVPDTAQSIEIMNRAGFERKTKTGYQTIWMDIRPDVEVLRKKLGTNWGRSLNRAQKAGMEIVWDTKGVYLPWVVISAVLDQLERKYQGASEKTMKALAGQFVRGENMLIGVALVDNQPIAAILVFIHGSCATYQVGYTSDMGRDKCAHHLLLWDALAVLKERSVHDFDLGGVNDESAKGVKAFKQGMGGQIYETAGLFI